MPVPGYNNPHGYDLLRVLGAGYSKKVFEARKLSNGKLVCLLQMNQSSESMNEVHNLQAVLRANNNRPAHICRYEAHLNFDGFLYIEVELFDYVLNNVNFVSGFLPPYSLMTIAVQTSRGLLEADRAGLILDDVKPENIGMTNNGRIAHFDLEHARPRSERKARGSTPGYQAPEITSTGHGSDTSSIYPWGKTILFFSCGQTSLPYGVSLCQAVPTVGKDFSQLIDECTEIDPARRPTQAVLWQRVEHAIQPRTDCNKCGAKKFVDAICPTPNC